MTRIFFIALAASAMIAGAAQAQNAAPLTNIDGDVALKADIDGSVVSSAIGSGSRSGVNVAGANGVGVKGNLNSQVAVRGSIVSTAIGKGSCSEVNIGWAGKTTCSD